MYYVTVTSMTVERPSNSIVVTNDVVLETRDLGLEASRGQKNESLGLGSGSLGLEDKVLQFF